MASQIPRVAGVMFSKYLPQGTRALIKQGIKKGSKQANKFINSIFTEYNKAIGRGTTAAVGALGLTGAANAKSTSNQSEIKSASNFDIMKARLQDYFRNVTRDDERGAMYRQDTLMNILGIFAGGSEAKTAQVAEKAISIAEKSGASAAIKFATEQAVKLRNELVKQSPKAAAAIEKGVSTVKGTIDDALKRFTGGKDWSMATEQEIKDLIGRDFRDATAEEIDNLLIKGLANTSDKELANAATGEVSEGLAALIKDNVAKLKALADEVGATKKAELPNLLKFTKELGKIILNSPNYIRAMATGRNVGLLANTGLSMYDLYQAFKKEGSLIPERVVANVSRVGVGAIAKNPIIAMLFGGLGYAVGDSLSQKALANVGVKQGSSEVEDKEIAQGLRHPGLTAQVPEYFDGLSGRKYHVVNDKVYAFDSGQAVNVNQALQDADDLIQFKTQQTQDQLSAVNQQLIDVENAQRQGYQIPENQIAQIVNTKNQLENELTTYQQTKFTQPDYSQAADEKELTQQVYTNEVQPGLKMQEFDKQKYWDDYNKLYEQVFSKVANDTYADLDKMYNKDTLALDYWDSVGKAYSGQGVYFTPDQYAKGMKMQAMRELVPQIRQKTESMLTQLESLAQAQRQYNLGLAAENRQQIKTSADIINDIEKRQETARHNRASEVTQGMTATAALKNAQTNAAELPIKQMNAQSAAINANVNKQLMPYKQASYIGQTTANVGMSGQNFDTILNANQSVMKEVFPEAFKEAPQGNAQQQSSQPNKLMQFTQTIKSKLGF